MLRPFIFCVALATLPAAAFAAPDLTLKPEIARYQKIVAEQIHAARLGAEDLEKKLAAGDLSGARQAWIAARQGWERSETVTARSFPDLDKAIDAWPTGSTGFHAIEGRLFNGGAATDLLPLAKGLAADLATIDGEAAKASYTVQGLYDGLAGLAYEVGESKSKGQESKASGTSLNDLKNNVHAVVALYDTVFADAFKRLKPEVDAKVRKQIAVVQKQIDVKDMTGINQRQLEKAAEMLAVIFVDNAAVLGLTPPTLESDEG